MAMHERNKKRLLFINGNLKTGGVEKSLVDILKNLDYEEYEVDLLLLEGLGEYADQLPSNVHVKLRCLENTYGSVISSLCSCIQKRDWLCFKMRLIFLMMKLFGQKQIKLSKELLTENKQYDCAIGFRSGICTQIAAYAVETNKKITWWHHGSVEYDPTYLETVTHCDKVVAVSKGCRKMLEDKFPMLTPKTTVIPNMVISAEIEKRADERCISISENKFLLISLGRIAPEKHFENVVFAAEYLIENGISNFEWHIVGGDWDYENIRDLVALHHMEKYVIMEGIKENPYPYLKGADLFVHPSYVESQGLTVLEAMTLGVPCVVTKSLGPCEFIQDGENGLLVEQGWEPLAEGVLRMLTDKDLYEKIKSNTHCPEQFAPETVMRKIESLL